jgi:hypothetical protein
MIAQIPHTAVQLPHQHAGIKEENFQIQDKYPSEEIAPPIAEEEMSLQC